MLSLTDRRHILDRKRVREVEKKRSQGGLYRRIVALTLLFALLLPLCRIDAEAAGYGPVRPKKGVSASVPPHEESSADWEASVDKCMRTGDWRRDLIEVAKTQLGYRESTTDTREINGANFGYTRYGDFMDSAESVVYGPWCASFVSFCLYYAGVKPMPLSSGCRAMVRKLVDAGYYRPAGEYEPKPGDLIFFYSGWPVDLEKLNSGHVGIIVEINDGVATTIEGGREIVMYFEHDLKKQAGTIMGYGEIPDNPDYRTVTDEKGLVSVSGILPEGVTVQTRSMAPAKAAQYLQEQEIVCCACNVSLMLDGKEYNPKRPFSITLHQKGLEGENLRVVQLLGREESKERGTWPVYYYSCDDQGVSFVTNFLSDIAVMGPAPQPADELAEQTEAAPEKTNTGKAVS